MITFRWLILRLFGSLLLLLMMAFPVFWLLHEVVYPGVDLADEFIVLGLWILLFAFTSWLLSRIGAKRFALLEAAGREAIAGNQNKAAEETLYHIQSLFASGLVSGSFQRKVKRPLLRQYFSFFANHLENAQHREQVREALREGVRAEEGFELLKNYVLQQPALTLPTIDLAEELLERQPDDSDLLLFLTQKYLQERQTHFRAEYVFRQYLARNGPLVPKIIDLCLARLLSSHAGHRVDDFAAWCYLRAFQHGEENNATLRQLLHETQLCFQRVGRHDTFAKAVATITSDFSAEEIAGWAVARQERQARSWRFQAARVLFKLQQQLLELFSRLREQRKWLYRFAGAIVVLGVGYFVLSGKPAKVQNKTVAPAPEDSTAVYYALQVGAIRNANTAQREAERFRKRGLEVHVFKPGPSQRLHRIRVGKYRSKQAAQMAADSLKSAGIVRDCFITEYEKR